MYRVIEVKSNIVHFTPSEKHTEKYFITRFFAKRYYAKVSKTNYFTSLSEKFGDEWAVLHLTKNQYGKTKK